MRPDIQLDQRGLRLDLLLVAGATALGAAGVLIFDLPNGLVFGVAAGAIMIVTLRVTFVVNHETRIRIVDILSRKYVGRLDGDAGVAADARDFDRIRLRLWLVFALLAAIICVNAASFAISGDMGSAVAALLPSLLASAAVGSRK